MHLAMPLAVYVGAPWRSRFLRAPKIGLVLANAPGFVALERLATAKLGLKTGKDDFFFLSRRKVDPAAGDPSPALLRRRGVIPVAGMAQWTGEISSSDLRPAILNPHELFAEHGRRFVIPKETASLYLYPRPGRLRADLGTYVQLGELADVHRGKLVASNASNDAWYRQVRAVVASPWVLPYNSAYDYGAWDNAAGAVLNGRLVGVDPLEGLESDLLGAALNSTFAIVGRLLEGTATGVEGALDVGPPAVRRIKVPDVRVLRGEAADEVREMVERLRSDDTMPPAPSRTSVVSPLRSRLDVALLRALGRSKGQASALVGEMYESYARWRADVEDVEQLMRQNRRQMTRTGQSRTVRPADQAGRRVWEELQGTVPLYPAGLLTTVDALEIVTLPRAVAIPASEALFDAGVLRGHGGRSVDLGSFSRVRFVGMLRELGFESPLSVLSNPTKAGAVVDQFERDRRRFLAEARRRASGYVNGAEVVAEAVSVAERHWFHACRTAGMGSQDLTENDGTTSEALHIAPTLTAPVAGKQTPRRRGR